jgi:mannose-6-phosphate isomerase-like protein (cupin superfamily)
VEAPVMKRILAGLALVAGYVVISSLCHYVLFPEPGPDPSDLPRRGMTIVNEGIRSTFVYRQTSIETAGRLFEWESLVEPGGGPIAFPHRHPRLREIFKVVDGDVRFVVNGEERVVRSGEAIVVPPGSVHAFQNASAKPARIVTHFEPAEDGPWEELARRGLLIDSQFVQLERTGGLGRVSVIQLIVFGSRFRQGYAAVVPTTLQDLVSFLVAPTARLFGLHAYYPPPKPPG